jgi:hypothetical protein
MRNGGDVVLEFARWFRSNYSKKDYAFAIREFEAECIISDGKRYKVVDIYPQKMDGFYFIVYKKIPIKESFKKNTYIKDNVFAEHRVYV